MARSSASWARPAFLRASRAPTRCVWTRKLVRVASACGGSQTFRTPFSGRRSRRAPSATRTSGWSARTRLWSRSRATVRGRSFRRPARSLTRPVSCGSTEWEQ
eukprot:11202244-Lingulodinium_polyedra.AAC.1